MTDNRQTATKVKGKRGRRKREESTFYKTVLEKASESFAVVARSHYHTKLHHIRQEKHDYQQIYVWIPMTIGLPDLLCLIYVISMEFLRPRHSSRPTSLAARNKKKRLYSQARFFYQTIGVYLQEGTYRAFGVLKQ